jgi:hypothetical protein
MFPVIVRSAFRAAMSLVVLGACATIVAKTPVQGDSKTLSQLAGEWEGTYTSPETGRSGEILFRLRAGTDTAEGTVVMSGDRMGAASDAEAKAPALRNPGAASPVLTIRFVQLAGDEVEGALDPYRDPDCGCTLTTTFRGRLTGNVIEGTFASQGSGFFHIPTSGRWRVTRTSRAK